VRCISHASEGALCLSEPRSAAVYIRASGGCTFLFFFFLGKKKGSMQSKLGTLSRPLFRPGCCACAPKAQMAGPARKICFNQVSAPRRSELTAQEQIA